MTPRRWAATALLLLAAFGLLWWSTSELKRDERARKTVLVATPAPPAFGSPAAPSGAEPQLGAVESTAPHQPLASLPSPRPDTSLPQTPTPAVRETSRHLAPGASANIEHELDQVNLMLRDFRTIAGANPTGTNAEIMKAVMGDNPRQATLGPPAGQSLNAQGELVDPWGTPYFFHQISGLQMEIRSAGPDRVLWNDDDQTMTSASGASVPPVR